MKRDWIACNTCGEDDYKVLSRVDEWPIGKCGKCGTVYVNPVPFFEPCQEFSDISQEFQYTRYMREEITPEILAHDREQLKKQYREIVRLTGHDWPTIRFLDVGCGSGSSVKGATDLGWQATGLDIDPELIEAGRAQLKVDLRCTTLHAAAFTDAEFDFVRLRDVIEHLPNPYDSLIEIMRILKPGGLLLLATPNEAGLPTQMRLWFGGKRNKVATVPPPHHLHGFTPETLNQILNRAGFTVPLVTTTTPIDANYVTSNNMRQSGNRTYAALWKSAQMFGYGSMLIAWAIKEQKAI